MVFKVSFSADVKEELSKISNFNQEILKLELFGYILSGNCIEKNGNIEFITENDFNIEHLYKILFNLKIDYEPEIRGKCYIAKFIKNDDIFDIFQNYDILNEDLNRNIVKGAFLGSGSVNNPDKNYHLEITFLNERYSNIISSICEKYGVNFKKIKLNEKTQIYLKESEEISRFLALIGANRAVLNLEDVRVMKEMKNKVNRKVNCETANLNKTIDAAIRQIEDINIIKKQGTFENLPKDLKQVAILRLENPDLSLKDLGEMLEPKLSKSAINRKFTKIHEISENLI